MKTLTVVLTKKDTQVWLSGEMVKKLPPTNKKFDVELDGKTAHIEIKTLGQKKTILQGKEINWDTNVKDLITKGVLRNYVGEMFNIPDISVGELRKKVIELLHTKKTFTEEEWHLYHLQQVFELHPEFYRWKPKYVETNEYEGFDCPLSYENKTIQAFTVRKNTNSCIWAKDSIIIAWHIDKEKRKKLKGKRFSEQIIRRFTRQRNRG